MGRVATGIRCAVNTEVGYESYSLQPCTKAKKVLVIGGGPAGMEAARVAALRGHKVTIIEKNEKLGGHLTEASVPEFKKDLGNFNEWLISQMGANGIKVVTGKEVTPAYLTEAKPDAVVIATGSIALRPNIPGIDKSNVVTAIDVLLGKADSGKHPIVAGGGAVGSETALYLAQQGKNVTLIEMLPAVASDVAVIRAPLTAALIDAKVKIITGAKIIAINDDGVTAISANKEIINLVGDKVLLALGMATENKLYQKIHEKVNEVYVIGDATEPRRVSDAVHEGYRVGSVI